MIDQTEHARKLPESGEQIIKKWRWLRHRIKYIIGGAVNRHPYFWYAAWWLMPRIKLLLPHEKSYYGFKHLSVEGEGLFLDVGANNGLSALGFRRLVPHYRIFSIEANGVHEPALSKLKRRLKKFDYVIAAAGADTSDLTLHTAVFKGMLLHTGTSLNLEYLKTSVDKAFPKWVSQYLSYVVRTVQVIKLDDLNLHPDLVKTDVEGFEFEVLTGLKRTITSCRPSILIEFNPTLATKLKPFCEELRYLMYSYDDLNDRFVPFDIEREAHVSANDASPMNVFLLPVEKVAGLPIVSNEPVLMEQTS